MTTIGAAEFADDITDTAVTLTSVNIGGRPRAVGTGPSWAPTRRPTGPVAVTGVPGGPAVLPIARERTADCHRLPAASPRRSAVAKTAVFRACGNGLAGRRAGTLR
jgi:hypothetical protein